jgi:NlpC/P60 family
MRRTIGTFHPTSVNKRMFAARFAWIGCAAASLAVAQAAWPQDPAPRAHLVTPKQGREIVAAARDHDEPERGTQDCSHLVNEIYVRAGFSYPYTNSFDLYAGIANFKRVKNPRPGDLIVWPGHVGIVFDPKEHVFYSLVRSGLDTEDYDAPYWRARGRPRFFRYVVGGPEILTASRAPSAAQTPSDYESQNGARVLEERFNDGSSRTARSAKEASERSPVFGPTDSEGQDTTASVPRSIIVAEGRKAPTREQVAAGISELSSASGGALRANSTPLTIPVIVVERFSVSSMEIKRDHGWALVQVDTRASLTADESDVARRSDTVRWELRRGKTGWEAVSPSDRTYVPQDVAVRNIAARLADLTQQDSSGKDALRREEVRLTRLLSALLEESHD